MTQERVLTLSPRLLAPFGVAPIMQAYKGPRQSTTDNAMVSHVWPSTGMRKGIARLLHLEWFRPVHCKSVSVQEVGSLGFKGTP